MPLRSNEFAARDGLRIDFRSDPLRVRVDSTNLVTSDQHELRCVFEFSARIGDHAADRQLFAEVLMADRSTVTREDVAFHFQPALESAAGSTASQPVAQLLSDAGKAALTEVLRIAMDASAFSFGLIILPPFQLEITSPTLARQQRESLQRARAEEQAAGRLDHLRHATDLLKQFDSIRAASPRISAGQVLERIAPADRGVLLDAMLASNTDRGGEEALFAVAGSQLVHIDTSQDQPSPKVFNLPETLGPLRSVSHTEIDGQRRLLIGARGGILVVDPESPDAAVAFSDNDIKSQLGFNRAIYLPGQNTILATHGEAGLVQWKLDKPAAPTRRFRGTEMVTDTHGPVRNVISLDRNTAVCSVFNSLFLIEGNSQRSVALESRTPIVAVVPDAERLFIIHEDGSVATLDRQTRKVIRVDRYGGTVCAAGALPWQNGLRLLLACEAGAIDCIGPDDSLVTRYNSAYRGLTKITANARFVAALSPDRQRLILWNVWDGRSPAHDLHLISLTRHRIADAAFS
jgi:hypothetical protein